MWPRLIVAFREESFTASGEGLGAFWKEGVIIAAGDKSSPGFLFVSRHLETENNTIVTTWFYNQSLRLAKACDCQEPLGNTVVWPLYP